MKMWKIGGAEYGDRRLARRAASGDHDAGEELVARYYESVYSYMLALCRNPVVAEDLTQATFTACWQTLANFEGRSLLRTWIHRIAHRQYMRWLDGSRDMAQLDENSCEPGFEAEVVNSLWIHAAIEQLEPDLRETLVLFYLQEMPCQEIAEVLSIPRGTVLSRLHTARQRLKGMLTLSEQRDRRVLGESPSENPYEGGNHYEMFKAPS